MLQTISVALCAFSFIVLANWSVASPLSDPGHSTPMDDLGIYIANNSTRWQGRAVPFSNNTSYYERAVSDWVDFDQRDGPCPPAADSYANMKSSLDSLKQQSAGPADAIPFLRDLQSFLRSLQGCPSTKGLAHYNPNDPLETLIKKVIDLCKDYLNLLSTLTDGLPILGPILGPIVYEIKCIIDDILNLTEDLSDELINELKALLAEITGLGCGLGLISLLTC